jgi:homoserine O-acetyltransferase/O-succinyltransferase
MARVQRLPDDPARRQADDPAGEVARFGTDEPLLLDAGVALSPYQIGYKTYGTLNADRSNAVLVCHALTGDQHVASDNPVTGKPGWWEIMIGPGKPIDTRPGRPRPTRQPASPSACRFRSSPFPTWCARRPCW